MKSQHSYSYSSINTKKKINMKYIIISIIAVVIVIGFILFFFVFNSDNNESTLNEFYSYIEQQDYESMYTLIDDSNIEYSEDEFVTRNTNIYEGIEASNIEVEVTNEEDNILTYTVTMDSIAGTITFENTTEFKDNKIVWDDSFIFPDLTSSDKVRIIETEATRGTIYDRNNVALATQGEAYSVGLVPGKLNGEEDYEEIADLLDLTVESIQNTMSASWINDDSFVPLKTITADDSDLENSLLEISGVKLSSVTIRTYPYGEITSHLTGYIQKVTAEDLEEHENEGYDENSYIGRSGIEAAKEEQLKGTNGIEIRIVDENNNLISTVAKIDVQDGEDIVLTIDIKLQQDLYESFEDDESASVAFDPTTGEVLALVSTPSYDSNDFVLGYTTEEWNELNNDEAEPLTNRFKGTYVPGSTMKTITASIGLETGTIDPDEDLTAQSSWQKDSSWGSYYVTSTHAASPNTLWYALVYSDNVYFAKAALNIGAENLIAGYESLKIGEEIPFELSLNTSQYTSDTFEDEIQIADSAYGQSEILMNPVQVAAIYGLYVNDGKMMTPHVVSTTEQSVWAEPFSTDTVDTVLDALIGVISDSGGTGHSLYTSSITLAGKTGTAEIKDSQDDTSGSEIGWVTVMSVDSDTPIVITSIVENVEDIGGSKYVASKLKEPLYNYLGI
ncbi:MAG: penicillin-binding transpeptidase domain-containing protein [Erysipelotrichaceae bacterium]|nr:penicillin-binding transpeptidase domain-containing protein [Erysipelotrichaceae bacterium]